MVLRSHVLCAWIVVAAVLGTPGMGRAACDCPIPPASIALTLAEVAFTGKVTEADSTKRSGGTYSGGVTEYTFEVLKNWKGRTSTGVKVAAPHERCGVNFQIGETYLVFAASLERVRWGGSGGPLTTSLCVGDSKTAGDASQDFIEIEDIVRRSGGGELDSLLVDQWFDQLRSDDEGPAQMALQWPQILRVHPDRCLPFLIDLLEDGDPELQSILVESFSEMAPNHIAAFQIVRAALKHPEEAVRETGVGGVLRLGIAAETKTALWSRAVDDSSARVRARALHLKTQFGRPDEVELGSMLSATDDEVRLRALEGLAELNAVDRYFDTASRMAEHPDHLVRSRALNVLYWAKDEKNARTMLDLGLTDAVPLVRVGAIRTLVRRNLDPLHTEANLIAGLDDAEANVRYSTAVAIYQAGFASGGLALALADAVSDPVDRVGEVAARTLSAMGLAAKDVLPQLRARLRGENDEYARARTQRAIRVIESIE